MCIRDSYKIVLVDNASNDRTSEVVKDYFEKVEYIRLEENTGFGRGHNIGIETAVKNNSKYYLALNPDSIIDKNFLKHPVNFLEEYNDYGGVSSRVMRLINGKLSSEPDVHGGYLKKYISYRNSDDPEKECDIFILPGTAPVYRIKALQECFMDGYFDPDYFLYFEDIDLSWRLKHRGWDIRYIPNSKAWHVKGGSTQNKDSFFTKSPCYKGEILKNRYSTIIKNLPFPIFLRLLPWLILAEIAIFLYFLFANPKGLKFYFKAVKDTFKRRKILFQYREKILSESKLSCWRIKGMIKGL